MRCKNCGKPASRGHRAKLSSFPEPRMGGAEEVCASVAATLREDPLPSPEAATRSLNAQLGKYGLKIYRGSVLITDPTDVGKPIPDVVTDRNLRQNWGKPVGLFSGVSKMPGKSFSIPAGGFKSGGRCHIADVDIEQSICDGCYALQGQYLQGSAQRAQWQRLMWIERTYNEFGPEAAGRALAIAIRWLARDPQRKSGGSRRRQSVLDSSKFFRLHDSGAVFSPLYAQTWLAAACYLYLSEPPRISIWIPVRIWAVALRDAKAQGGGLELARRHRTLAPLIEANTLPNVTVRPSALSWGKTAQSERDDHGISSLAPAFPGLSAGSGTWMKGETVPEGYEFCSAPSQAGRCFGDLPDAKPSARGGWRLVETKDGFELYERFRKTARIGKAAGTRETRMRWLGGGHRCTSCWNPAVFVLYGEHGEMASSGGVPGISSKTIDRMTKIRKLVQRHKNPKLIKIGKGRLNRHSWLVMDPSTSTVFAKLYTSEGAARQARKSDLLVVHDGSGQIFDPHTKKCVGMVMS